MYTVWNLQRGILSLACMIWMSLIFLFLSAQNVSSSTHSLWTKKQCCITLALYYFDLCVEFVSDLRNYSVLFMTLYARDFTFLSQLFYFASTKILRLESLVLYYKICTLYLKALTEMRERRGGKKKCIQQDFSFKKQGASLTNSYPLCEGTDGNERQGRGSGRRVGCPR